VVGDRIRREPLPKVALVETPSLDPFTFFKHYEHDKGETICLTHEQFDRVSSIGHFLGTVDPNGPNLVSYYGTPLENTFGVATLKLRGGKPVGFFDIYDFNLRGAKRSFVGQTKTIVGRVLGVGGEPFRTKFPC